MADLWRMIWEQEVVILAHLKEDVCDSCCHWLDRGCWTYGHVAVEDSDVLVDYTIRKFYVQHIRSIEWLLLGNDFHLTLCPSRSNRMMPRVVTPLHFTNWPNFGVSFSPIGMLKFQESQRRSSRPSRPSWSTAGTLQAPRFKIFLWLMLRM
ncbi:receptor-type tyrosine-protein phosphatase alpha-like [Hippocampus zosterae]|uniref:receptor-type tyrosine-protein phosphatase alpha-like n=1 Tax=Hippocampus zosterae TaxID=109293 RepID=UPI00223CED0E|nr:receptor-type tyrosine-protein phosphatase alpha-like [Hippocampus zosterae]